MATTDSDVDGVGEDRYGQFTLDDGSIVIYDTTQATAWIQSDSAVASESVA